MKRLLLFALALTAAYALAATPYQVVMLPAGQVPFGPSGMTGVTVGTVGTTQGVTRIDVYGYATNYYTNSTMSLYVTGDGTGGGGGDYWQTNRFVVNEGADRPGIIVSFTNNVAQRIPMFHVCYQNGLTFNTNTFGFNAPFSNHLYRAKWSGNDGNSANHGAIVYLARNGSQWNFTGQNTNNLSNTGCRFFSGVEGSDTDHGAFIGGSVLFRPQTNDQEFAVTVIIFSGGVWSLFNSQLEVEDLGPIVGTFEL